VPRTWNGFTSSLGQYPDCFLLVERHRALEVRRPDARVHLGCVDTRMSQERAHLLEIVMLFVNFHCHAVTQVVGLELRVADDATIDLTEAPDVLPGHGRSRLADRAPVPRWTRTMASPARPTPPPASTLARRTPPGTP